MPASKYTKEMGQQAYDLACQGKFDTQIARALGVTSQTLYAWANDKNKPEFKELWDMRKEARQAHYEDMVQKIIFEDRKCSTAQKDLLVRTLITQFSGNWSENKKTTLEITDKTKNMSDQELERMIQTKIRQLSGLKPDLKIATNSDDKKDK